MFKIEGDKAVFTFTLDELSWLHDHLPWDDGASQEIYEAIVQLETAALDAKQRR